MGNDPTDQGFRHDCWIVPLPEVNSYPANDSVEVLDVYLCIYRGLTIALFLTCFNIEFGHLFNYCCRLFEACPDAKVLFGFDKDLDPHCDAVIQSKQFLFQASNFINMIDMTLNMVSTCQV